MFCSQSHELRISGKTHVLNGNISRCDEYKYLYKNTKSFEENKFFSANKYFIKTFDVYSCSIKVEIECWRNI